MVRVISTAELRGYDYGGDSGADGWFAAEPTPSSVSTSNRRKKGRNGRIVRGKTIGKIVKSSVPPPPRIRLEVGSQISTSKFPWEK